MSISIKSLNSDWSSLIDTEITVNGWIQSIRKQSSLFFISLNDGSHPSSLQITGMYSLSDLRPSASGNPSDFKHIIDLLTTGTAITASGLLIKSPAKGQYYELQVNNITTDAIIKNVEEYPIAKTRLSLEYLRTLPHLRSRTKFFSCVNRIRHSMMMATHLFYDKHDFLLLDPNILTVNECEGGAGVFTVSELLDKNISTIPTDTSGNIDYSKDHFRRKVFLTVSSQLHLEALALSMKKVYTTNKSFRAEHSLTNKHVSEFSHLEIEQCFTTFNELIDIAEDYIKFVLKYVYDRNIDDLKQLEQISHYMKENMDVEFMKRYDFIDKEWIKLKYIDAINILKQHKHKLSPESVPEYGHDMNSECEKFLTEYMGGPVFLTHWPQDIKSFYMKQLDDGTCESFDLLMPGIGELIGASQREESYEKILSQMSKKGIQPSGLDFYLDLRKYGSCSHGGFGLGLDRLLMFLTGMKNIKDVIPFPIYYTSCNF